MKKYILNVVYCLSNYHLNWRLCPVMLEKNADKLIDRCVRLTSNTKKNTNITKKKGYL